MLYAIGRARAAFACALLAACSLTGSLPHSLAHCCPLLPVCCLPLLVCTIYTCSPPFCLLLAACCLRHAAYLSRGRAQVASYYLLLTTYCILLTACYFLTAGFFQGLEGRAACKPYPPGSSCAEGATEPLACSAGCAEGATEPSACGAGWLLTLPILAMLLNTTHCCLLATNRFFFC